MKKELCLLYVGANEELINVQPIKSLPYDCSFKNFMETQNMISLGVYKVRVGFAPVNNKYDFESSSYKEYRNKHLKH